MSHVPEYDVEAGEFLLDGRYEVIAKLGSGSMARVVRARDHLIDEVVACKFPRDGSAGRVDALRKQRAVLAKLGSRNFPAIRDYQRNPDESRPFEFMVLELVQGTTLEDWHPDKPLRSRLEAIAQVAEGLASLAREGHQHGDLDACNVMLTGDGRVVLIDPDAERFGSSLRPREVVTAERTDRQGFRWIVETVLRSDERAMVAGLLERLDPPPPRPGFAALAPASLEDAAATVRNLLTLPFLPGEISRPLEATAASYLTKRDQEQVLYRTLCEQRDLTFRNLRDLVCRVIAPFAVKPPDDGTKTVTEAGLLKSELSSTPGGQLWDRLLACEFSYGDRLLLGFYGQSPGFRKPWPFPEQPGLMSKGHLSVERSNQVVSTQKLELHLRNGVPVVFVHDVNRVAPFDEGPLTRMVRILNEQIYPGLTSVEVQPRSLPLPVDANSVPKRFDMLRVRLGVAGGLLIGVHPEKFLVPALEEVFRPSSSATYNPAAGPALARFFLVPSSPSERAKIVAQAVKEFRESLGMFFSPLYRIDVAVLDESERTLRIDFEGMMSNRHVLTHSFEVSLPTPEMLWKKARAKVGAVQEAVAADSAPAAKKVSRKRRATKLPGG